MCTGKKIVRGLDELTLYIEKGMPNGHEIVEILLKQKFEEFGEERADVSPGHLIFVIQELPHPIFQRDRNDLHTILQITLKEALLGFEKEIKHLDDHIVTISKNGVVQPGDIIKIRGEGMPIHQSSDTGDMFVKIEIVLPTELTEKQKESKLKLNQSPNYFLIKDLVGRI